MQTIDIIILICFLPAVWVGIRKGLMSQLLGIIALILSIWASFKFNAPVTEWLSGKITLDANALKIISFAVIFVAIFVATRLLCFLLEKVLKLAMLGWLNKLLGVVFALLKYALVIGLLIIIFNTVNTHFSLVDEDKLEGAVVYQTIKGAAYTVFPYLKEMLF